MSCVGSQNFGVGPKKWQGSKFWGGWNSNFVNFYYDSKVLLEILVSSL